MFHMTPLSGIEVYQAWDGFLDKWLKLAETDEYGAATQAVESAFVSDTTAFHFFYLQVCIPRVGSTKRIWKGGGTDSHCESYSEAPL